jgi:hypothetical protein
MYEQFGFSRSANGEQCLTLFVPDNTIDPHNTALAVPAILMRFA